MLTWDRAFIYEPRRDSDVADVLEVANAQLLEMRYYDELLDAELPRMYDLIERKVAEIPVGVSCNLDDDGTFDYVCGVEVALWRNGDNADPA